MKKLVSSAVVVSLVCGLVVLGFVAGCEEAEQNQDITIELSSDSISGKASVSCTATLTVPDNAISGTVSTLMLPLEWWVGNTSLGNIISSEGNTAVYVSTGIGGGNTISVRDQQGASGTVGITQTTD